jgi:hypothetical protein
MYLGVLPVSRLLPVFEAIVSSRIWPKRSFSGARLGRDSQGVGTVLYAVAIGSLVQRLLPLFTVRVGNGPDARPSVTVHRNQSSDLAGHEMRRLVAPFLRNPAPESTSVAEAISR